MTRQMNQWLASRRPQPNTVRKHIPWISSPLDHKAMLSETRGDVKANREEHLRDLDTEPSHSRYADLNRPIFKTRHESSKIELFYDLFFVANLSTFTADHEINTPRALGSYMGFFCLLWFTWLQTSLFDVRFAMDCAFSRACKCVSFGVMTGFFIIGSQYDTAEVENETKAFRALSIILAVSRLALALQYAVVWYFVKGYKKTLVPLTLTMMTLILTAAVYLGIFFTFHEGVDKPAYIGWYSLAAFEAFTILTISCLWRVVSFKHTHLMERVGLLTLIIMGEGVIGLSKSVAKIMQNSENTSSRDIGVIASAVLLIYFIWVLYFDQIEYDRFGAIRQQIWFLLHFPLHVALLLAEEGNTQFIIWNTVVENWFFVQKALAVLADSVTPGEPAVYSSSADYVSALNQTLQIIDGKFKNYGLSDFSANLATIEALDINSDSGRNETLNIVQSIYTTILASILDRFGVESEGLQELDADPDLNAFYGSVELFSTVLLYFLISSGMLLVLLGIMYTLGKKHKTVGDIISACVRIVAGLVLTLLSLLCFNADSYAALLYSPWVIPLVVMVYAIVIVLDNLLTWRDNKIANRDAAAAGTMVYAVTHFPVDSDEELAETAANDYFLRSTAHLTNGSEQQQQRYQQQQQQYSSRHF